MRLYLVRHLAPLVAPGLCYGRTDLAVDPALQARAVPALRAALPRGLPFYASPLQRCAALAAALTDSAVTLDARLAELDFGAWENQPWDAIARAEVDAWAADTVHYQPGGGESVLAMAERVSAFYDDVMRIDGDGAVVVCHAGTMRLLAARVRGLERACGPLAMAHAAAAHPHAIGYGEILSLDVV